MSDMARPLEYDSERHVIEAMKYIASCEDRLTESGNLLQVKLPSIEGLALYLRINRDTVYAWAKTYPEFSDILETLRLTQADKLLNNGLCGTYNSTIAKVILTKHGYNDKQEIDQKTELSGTISHRIDYSKLSDQALNEIANAGDTTGNRPE